MPSNGGTTGGGKGRVGWSTTLHVNGNIMEGNDTINADNWKGVKMDSSVSEWTKCERITDGVEVDGVIKPNNQYLDTHPVISQSVDAAYDEVLAYAGASHKRDSVDTRIVNDVINKTAPTGTNSGYGMVNFISDVGGFPEPDCGVKAADADNDGIPDDEEEKYGLDKDVYDSLTIGADGYTMLEKYTEALTVEEGKEKADKTAIREVIYTAQQLDEYDYTEESWENFSTELASAADVAATVYASQTELDEACARLSDAMSQLVEYNTCRRICVIL